MPETHVTEYKQSIVQALAPRETDYFHLSSETIRVRGELT